MALANVLIVKLGDRSGPGNPPAGIGRQDGPASPVAEPGESPGPKRADRSTDPGRGRRVRPEEEGFPPA